MSSDIESKVVEMRFDNTNFEANVRSTLSSIKTLEDGLKFNNVNVGFDEINKSVKRVSFDPLINGMNNVVNKAMIMHYMIKRTIENIADDIYRNFKKIGTELFVTPWKTGFNEYELKMNAIQTIMASSKEDLNTVNRYLNELNTYADRTIYSFSDMTQNIGKFTNAGVSLKDSVAAIQGIANVAAISGANTNEASRAMYNFAQALSAGYVKLIDWKSIENANMATKEFKEELIKTALELGTITEASEGMYEANGKAFNATKDFNNVLQEQWLTTDVLVKTLSNYTDETTDIGKRAIAAAQEVKTLTQLYDTLKESAQSSWAETWEIIIGDFHEAKALYTEISKAVSSFLDEIGNKRNDFLSDVFDSNIKKFKKNLAEAGLSLDNLTENIKDYAIGQGQLTKEAANGIETFDELVRSGLVSEDLIYSAYKNFVQVYSDLTDEELKAEGFTDSQIARLRELKKNYRSVTDEMKTLVEGFDELGGREMIINTVRKSFQLLYELIKPIGKAFKDIFPAISADKVKAVIKSIHDFVMGLKPSETLLQNIGKTFEGVFAFFDIILITLKRIFGPVISYIGWLLSKIGTVAELIFSVTGAIGERIKSFRDSYKDGNALVSIFSGLEKVFRSLSSFSFSKIKEKFDYFFKKRSTTFGDEFVELPSKFETFIKKMKVNFPDLTNIKKTLSDFFFNLTTKFKDFTKIDIKKIPSMIFDFMKGINVQIPNLHMVGDKIRDAFNFIFGKRETIFGDEFIKLPSRFETFIKKLKVNLPDLNSIKESMTSFFGNIKNFVFNNDAFDKDVFGNFRKNISESWENLKTYLSGLKEKIKNTITDVFKSALNLEDVDFSAIWDYIINLKDSIVNFFTNTDWFGIFEGIKNGVVTTLGYIKKFLGIDNLDEFVKLVKNISLIKLFGAGGNFLNDISSQNSTFLTNISNTFASGFGGIIGNISNFTNGVVGALNGVRESLEKYQKSLDSGKLQGLALAIGVMAAALIAMSFIDKDKLADSLKFLSALLGEIVVAMFIFSKIGDIKAEVGKTIGFLVGIGISLLIFTSVIKKIANMNPEELKQGLIGLGALLGEVALFLAAMQAISKYLGNDADLTKIAVSMFIFSFVLKQFTGVVESLGSMDLATLGKGLGGIFAIMEIIVMFIAQLELVNKHIGKSTNLLTVGIGMIAIAASLKLFTSAIKSIGEIDTSVLLKGIAVIAIIFTLVTLMTRFMGGNTIVQGVGLLIIAASLYVFAGAIMVFAAIPTNLIVKSLLAIGAGLAILAAFCWAVSGVILPVAFGMLTLSASVLVFGIGIAAIGAGLLFLAGGMAIFAAVGPTAAKAFVESLEIMLAGIINVLPLIGTLAAKAFVSLVDGLVESAGDLSQAIGRLIDLIIQFVTENSAKIVKMIFEPLIAILDEGKQYVPQFVSKLVDFLVACLDSLTEKLPVLIPSITNFVKALFGELAKAFEGADFGPLIQGSIVFGIVSGLMFVFAAISHFIPMAMKGVLGVGLVIAEMAVIIAAIGALSKIPGFKDLLGEGGKILQQVGEAIGGFIGGIIGSTMETITSKLPNMGKHLSEFMENLQPFIKGAEKLKIAAPGVQVLISLVKELTAAQIWDGIMTFFTGKRSSLLDFGKELVEFAPYMVEFSDIIAGNIDTAAVSSAANLALMLSNLANSMPTEGGFFEWFTGKKETLKAFGEDLVAFAPKLVTFSELLKKYPINEEAVKSAVNAGELLSGFSKSLDKEGGVADWFTGTTQTLSVFGEELVAFVPNLITFSEILKKNPINEQAVKSAINAGELLSGFSKSLDKEGGVADWFTGTTKTLEAFGKDLEAFGPSLISFSNLVSNNPVNEEAVTSAANAAKVLTSLSENMPKEDTWWSKLFGNNISLGDFAAKLIPFGENMKKFSDSIIGIDAANFDTIVSILESITGILNVIPETETLFGIETKNPIVDLGENLLKFGTSFIKFYNNVSTIDSTVLSDVILQLNSIIDTCGKMFGIDTESVSNFSKAFGDLAKAGIKDFVTAFEDSYETVKKTAEDLLIKFLNGLDNKKSEITNFFTELANAILNEVSGKYDSFYSAGQSIVQGFADGISQNTFLAEVAAATMAQAAYDAATSALKINSPSKVFTEIGSNIPIGLAKGIKNNTKYVDNSIYGMTNNALNYARNIISRIAEVMDGDLDNQPVIRPIMDLSEIQNGIKNIDAIFSKKQAYLINDGFYSRGANSGNNFNTNDFYDNRKYGDIVIYTGADPQEVIKAIENRLNRELRMSGYSR